MSDEFDPENDPGLKAHFEKFKTLTKQAQKMFDRRAKEKKARKDAGEDFNSFLADPDTLRETWATDGMTFYITQHPKWEHYCGYVRFPKRPTMEPGYSGILTYVPVHGGITYTEDSPDGSVVYGFDCHHASDDQDDQHDPGMFEARMAKFEETKNPADLMPKLKVRSRKWLRDQCETMGRCIRICAQHEGLYLASDGDNEARAKVIDMLHDYMRKEAAGKFDLTDNTGAMLKLLGGQL